MPRWYKGYRCLGHPRNIVDRLRAFIDNNNLGIYIPSARIEKKVRSGEFYLFLSIEGPEVGVLPPEVEWMLPQLSFLGTTFEQPFVEQEIYRMAGAELDVHQYISRLSYLAPTPVIDPFCLEMEETGRDGPATPETRDRRSVAFDNLLLWLSAVKAGTWTQFQNACQALELETASDNARRIVRRLKLLGHIEISPDGQRWSIGPTIFAVPSTAMNNSRFILCGQRDRRLIEALRDLADVTLEPQIGVDAPSTVIVSTKQPADLKASIQELQLPIAMPSDGSIATRFAQLLPELPKWKQTLQTLPGLLIEAYHVRRFDGENFIEVPFAGVTGFYQLWLLRREHSESQHPKYTLFYDAETSQWLRGDWYGLRYLANIQEGDHCPISYEGGSRRLAIPISWRWPELYERTLVLSSGQLPQITNGWLIYKEIDRSILDLMKSKLNLQL